MNTRSPSSKTPTAAASARDALDRAWRARLNQENEMALALAAEAKSLLGIPLGRLTDADIAECASHRDSAGKSLLVEILALSASLARTQRDVNYSAELIAAAQRLSVGLFLDPPARYGLAQERGLTAYMKGDYSQALEHFIGASLASLTPRQQYQSSMNALLCLENLGLPHDATLTRAREAADRLTSETRDVSQTRELLSPLRLFERRMEMRAGELAGILDRSGDSQTSDQTGAQEDFVALWLRGMPWHRWSADHFETAIERLAMDKSYLHLAGYRLRTLQGILHPDDRRPMNPGHAVQRVYLWTWRWMGDPERFPVRRVLAVLRDFDIARSAEHFSVLDSWLLRNSLLWLSLFDGGGRSVIHESLDALREARSNESLLFGMERLVVLYFAARRDGRLVEADDLRRAIETHPLWGSGDLHFRALVEGETGDIDAVPEAIRPLVQNIRKLLQSRDQIARAPVVVDLARGLVTIRSSGERVMSDPMTRGLDLLRRQSVVGMADFVAHAFGIHRYDPIVHDTKVFNLLSRLRRLVPDTALQVGVKNGRVYARGEWSGVAFVDAPSMTDEIRGDALCEELSTARREAFAETAITRSGAVFATPKDQLFAAMSQRQVSFITRVEAEEILGASRSTAGRVLDKLVRDGALVVEGKGKNSRYVAPETVG
jgi:hypothetical protein